MEKILFDYISQYVELNDAEKQAIIDLKIFKSFKKGEIILKEGQKTDEGYFVLKGCIRKYYVIEGEEKTTSFYTELEGEVPECVNTKQPSKYFISTSEDSIVSISTPVMEAEIFAKFPKFETLCRILSEELVVKQQISFDDFKNSSPEQRYQTVLENRPDLIQRVPQHQLASFLGMTAQSLSRIKGRLVEQKK